MIPRLLPRYALDWPDARARALPREAPANAGCSSSWNAASSTSALPTLLLREGPFDYTEVLVDPYPLSTVVAHDSAPLSLSSTQSPPVSVSVTGSRRA